MKNGLILTILIVVMAACSRHTEPADEAGDTGFSFVFMTDIHLKPEMGAPEGFQLGICGLWLGNRRANSLTDTYQ